MQDLPISALSNTLFDIASVFDVACDTTDGSVALGDSDAIVELLEQSDDCMKVLNIDGHIDFINCGGLRSLEIDRPQWIIGQLWWRLWPVEKQSSVRQRFQAAMLGQEICFEANCPTMKGNHRRWRVYLKPILAQDGRVVSVLCASHALADDCAPA